MLFDQRTRKALRSEGVSAETLRRVEDAATADARDTADEVEAFFDAYDTVYSDMELTHSASDYPEHAVEYADLFTHSQDVRGFLRFDTWGAYVEGARVLSEDLVELTLGPTVHGRVRFAPDREALR